MKAGKQRDKQTDTTDKTGSQTDTVCCNKLNAYEFGWVIRNKTSNDSKTSSHLPHRLYGLIVITRQAKSIHKICLSAGAEEEDNYFRNIRQHFSS